MHSTKSTFDIRELFRATMARHPNPVLDDDTKKAYLEDWKELSSQVGIQRFEEAVKRARSYSDFFPKISQIRQFIPSAEEVGKERGTLADYDCRDCKGTGWSPAGMVHGNYAVRRCQCWIRNRDAGAQPRDHVKRMMAECYEFERSGEHFYTLADVFKAVAEKVIAGEIRPKDPGWVEWAKHFIASKS